MARLPGYLHHRLEASDAGLRVVIRPKRWHPGWWLVVLRSGAMLVLGRWWLSHGSLARGRLGWTIHRFVHCGSRWSDGGRCLLCRAVWAVAEHDWMVRP